MGVNRTTGGSRVLAGLVVLLVTTAGCAARTAQPRDTQRALDRDLQAERRRAAALEQALEQKSQEVQLLSVEIDKLRAREENLTASLKRLLRQRPGAMERGAASAETPERAQIASLKEKLAQERERRTALETELDRLRQETSAAPFERHPETEHGRLEQELTQERNGRLQLLAQLRTLQDRAAAARHGRAGAGGAWERGLRARLVELENRQQDFMVSVARTMASDNRREEEEMVALVAPSAFPAPASGAPHAGELEADNARLRSLLADERQRNARLAAKLKVASRVTDLIFRIQDQEREAGAPESGD